MTELNNENRERRKKPYRKPEIEIHAVQTEKNLMIAVSGTTTPEESQAKGFDPYTDGDDDAWEIRSHGLWDDEQDF